MTEEKPDSAVASVVSVLATLGVPVTVATALLLYFGWARTDQQARYMGLDVSLFGYSTQDYILRSVNTLYVPLLVGAAVTLAWLALHQWSQRSVQRGRLRVAGRIALYAGLAVAIGTVVVASVNRTWAPLAVPLALALGTAIAAYGHWLIRSDSAVRNPVWQSALRMLLVGGIIALALFWELSNYAGVVGRGNALQIARSVPGLPRATAFSEAPLGIEAPGVREERLDAAYRTTGLRLLVRSGGRIFLLHDGWTPQRGTVIVLPDTDDVSWQFSRQP